MVDVRISKRNFEPLSEPMKGDKPLTASQAFGGNVNEAFDRQQQHRMYEQQLQTADQHLPSLSLHDHGSGAHDSPPQNAAPNASIKRSR